MTSRFPIEIMKFGADLVDPTGIASKLMDSFVLAHRAKLTKNAQTFFDHMHTQYDRMTPQDHDTLKSYLKSDVGQSLLSEYIEAISTLKSQKVSMALVLLMCGDADFKFSESDKSVFANAVQNMDDRMVDFFIYCARKNTTTDPRYPYDRNDISQSDLPNIPIPEIDVETVYVFVSQLIQRRLLLPPPEVNSSLLYGGDNVEWTTEYGVSNRSREFASLLHKAGQLI